MPSITRIVAFACTVLKVSSICINQLIKLTFFPLTSVRGDLRSTLGSWWNRTEVHERYVTRPGLYTIILSHLVRPLMKCPRWRLFNWKIVVSNWKVQQKYFSKYVLAECFYLIHVTLRFFLRTDDFKVHTSHPDVGDRSQAARGGQLHDTF